MKNFLALLVLFTSLSASAFVAFCNSLPGGNNSAVANHRLVYSDLDMDCLVKRKGYWSGTSISLKTYGPGLQLTGLEGIMITCPLVSAKRLNNVIKKKGAWKAVGVAASATAGLLGARAGIAVNHRLAVCTITGIATLGLGASAGFVEMSVNENLDNVAH